MELDDGHGKQRSKRLDAPKDNREHVFACQSETDAELSVMSRDETRAWLRLSLVGRPVTAGAGGGMTWHDTSWMRSSWADSTYCYDLPVLSAASLQGVMAG